MRETKNSVHSSPPVFSALNQDETENHESGRLVVSTDQTLRRKALPDLFAGSSPKSPAGIAENIEKIPPIREHIWPVLCGTIEYGGAYLAFLQYGGKTAVCATGDTLDGYTVVSVHRHSVQLEKDGIWTDVKL